MRAWRRLYVAAPHGAASRFGWGSPRSRRASTALAPRTAMQPASPGFRRDAASSHPADTPGDIDFAPTGAIDKPAQTPATPEISQTPPAQAVSPAASAAAPAPAPPTKGVADLMPGALEALAGAGRRAQSAWRRRLACRATAVQSFYSSRAFAPVWADASGLSPAGRSTLARLKRAGEDGLDSPPSRCRTNSWPVCRRSGSPRSRRRFRRRRRSMRWRRAACGSFPRRFRPLITARPAVADPRRR